MCRPARLALLLPSVALLLPRTALALDTEPNDSCTSGETVSAVTFDGGELSSASDVDAFLYTAPAGTFTATLRNVGNADDDFVLSLYDSAGSVLLGSDTSSGGRASVSYGLSSQTTLCVQISGSEGAYTLGLDEFADAPSLTDVWDSGGSSITYAPRGAIVRLIGSGFGTSPTSVTVKFSGVWARPTSVTDTEIAVRVPQRAVDGDVVVFANGRESDVLSFSVGSSSITAPYFDPSPGSTTTVGGIRIALDHTLVFFSPDATGAQVASVLTTVQGLDAKRTGWSIAGASPYRALFQVEWSWSSAPTLTDLQSLLADLRAQGLVQSVLPETSVRLPGLEMPTDHNLVYDAGTAQGAYAQIGYEEARRLLRFSGIGALNSEPAVYVVDDGLMYGSSALWGTNEEFPTSHFSLYEYDGSDYSQTAAPGHFTTVPWWTYGAGYSHGTATAGLIGGGSQGDPPWYDGTARSSTNANGLLASLDLFGVDDDGDATIDEDGESVDFGVTVYNAVGEASEDGAPFLYTMWLPDLLESLAASLPTNTVVDFQVQVPRPGWDNVSSWSNAFSAAVRNLCRDRVLVFPAGNDASSDPRMNYVAQVALQQCPSNVLIVGATHAGGNGSGDDEHATWTSPATESNYGAHVNILAPGDGYTIPLAHRSFFGALSYSYASGGGTSGSAPFVAAAAALARALGDSTSSSAAMLVAQMRELTDNVGDVYTETSSPYRLNLHRLVAYLLPEDVTPAQHNPPAIYAVDYDDQVLVAQDIDDLSTGTLAGTATTVDVSGDCTQPVDVKVHPLGDVVYVLCKGNGVVAAYDTSGLELIDTVALDGTVNAYGQMTIAPDGMLYVPTTSGSTHQIESFDTYTGAVHVSATSVHSYSAAATYGAEASPLGDAVLTSSTPNSSASEDSDVLSLIELDPRSTSGYTVATDDLSSTTLTYLMRDVAWRWDGRSAFGVLYGDSTGSDAELYESDFASVAQDSTIDYCEYPVGISVSAEDYAFVSCQAEDYVAVIDVASTASSYTPSGYLSWKTSSGTAGSMDPTLSTVAPNSQFLAFGFQGSTSAYVYTAPMTTATGGGTVYNGSYDAIGYTFAKPRGIALTPLLSIASPRPGMEIGGVRRLHLLVRDPDVTSLAVSLDGTTSLCSGSVNSSGAWAFYDDCLLDTSTWGAGWHLVTVEATSGGQTYEIHAQYESR